MRANNRPRINSKVSGEGRKGGLASLKPLLSCKRALFCKYLAIVFLAAALDLPHQLHHCAVELWFQYPGVNVLLGLLSTRRSAGESVLHTPRGWRGFNRGSGKGLLYPKLDQNITKLPKQKTGLQKKKHTKSHLNVQETLVWLHFEAILPLWRRESNLLLSFLFLYLMWELKLSFDCPSSRCWGFMLSITMLRTKWWESASFPCNPIRCLNCCCKVCS